MLHLMRRYGSTWLIKGALALIIISFTLFFGYERFAGKQIDARDYAAVIGDEAIPRPRYDLAYESTFKQMQEGLKDKMPEHFDETLRSMVLGEMLGQAAATQFARSLQLRITPQHLATQIVHLPNLTDASRAGGFDYDFYHKVFRPSYARRTGEDFEKALERDLLRDELVQLAHDSLEPWHQALPSSQNPEEVLAAWIRHYQQSLKVESYLSRS